MVRGEEVKVILGSKAMITDKQLRHRKLMGSEYFEAHTTMDFLNDTSL